MRFGSFAQMLDYYASVSPDSPALYYGTSVRNVCTFSELKRTVDARAAALSAEGKTCLGVFTDGSFACVVTIFAAVQAGLQVVLLDENTPDSILPDLIRYTDIDLLWGDPDLCDELSPFLTNGVADGARRILFFTSGTTDRSKAVVLTDGSLMASAYNGGAMLPLSPSDTLLCMLPLSHVFGFVCGLLWGLSMGAAVALGRGARHYADDCAFFHPTALSAVPLLWGFLLKYRAINPELKLVLIGAGDCPKTLLDAAKALGVRIAFGYGLTETSSGVALSTVGDPMAMAICPDDTITIAPDGEVLIAAPTCMMQGYYKRDADTKAVLQNGILRTGDLGFLDAQNRLHITGRKKEILVLSDGTKLFLPEYERACATVLETDELCIVLLDDIPTLVLGNQSRGDERAVLEQLASVLSERPRGQQLKKVLFYEKPLPRTATGKIKRWELQREVETA